MRKFIVNTNESYKCCAWRAMLNDCSTGRASAFFQRKQSVCRISKDDCIYLYQTGIGVIAKGFATCDYKMAECDGKDDEEYYVPIEFAWALDKCEWKEKAPTARDINQKMGTKHRFRHTVFEVSEMAQAIDCIFEEKDGHFAG